MSRPGEPRSVLLAGVVQESGDASWWVYESPMPPPLRRADELTLEIDTKLGTQVLPVDSRLLPDVPGARLVQVQLPETVAFTDIEALAVHGGIELRVDSPLVKDRRNVAVVRAPR